MSLRFARAALAMPRSGIREIMEMSSKIPNCIHLEVGQPDLPPPAAAIAVAQQKVPNHTQYISSFGLPALRESVARYFQRRTGVPTTSENIIITQGGVLSCMTSFMATLDPGDEVLVSDPGWPDYYMGIQLAHAVPVFYSLPLARAFLPDIRELERLVTPRTKMLIVNSPCNPTGQVLPTKVLGELMDFARAHNLFVLSDEIYSEIVFEGATAPSALQHDASERVIVVSGMSKNYSMTGFRVGFTRASPEYIQLAGKLQEPVVSCGVGFAQAAAAAALDGPQDDVAAARERYRVRRDIAMEQLRAHGLHSYTPAGAFYVLVDISAAKMNARDFAIRLLREHHVAVAPGNTFGRNATHLIRVSFSTSDEHVREGMRRLCEFVTALSKGK
eukprot:m.11265 g.11265  ORF g.11265 m.11265 type:complete len:388 (+) comp5756_c0_seq1:17-1180(+)